MDWGCGNGHFAYALIKMGLKVSAYSFDDLPPVLQQFPPAGLEFVKGSPGDPVTLPFADRTFDAVFSVGVLEHVGDHGGREASSLAEIGRVLKERGVFVAYHLPNALSWVEFFSRRFPGMHSHRRLYTRSEIHSIGRRARLEMLDVKRYWFMPRWFLNRLPQRVTGSPAFRAAYLGLDRALTLALNPWCTNYYFVARKVNAPKP